MAMADSWHYSGRNTTWTEETMDHSWAEAAETIAKTEDFPT